MEGNEEVLIQDEKLDGLPPEKVQLTDEELDALIEKRLGGKPTEFIRKSEQIKVLTPEEKIAAEEDKEKEIRKFALDQKIYSPKEYDEYIAEKQGDKVSILRKKYIEDNPEDKNAGKVFDRIYRIDEDDELEDGDDFKPNDAKAKALQLLEKQGEDYLTNKYGKINTASKRYESFLADQNVIKENTQLVTKALTEVPKQFEIETESGAKYVFPFSDEDLLEAQKIVSDNDNLKRKDLTTEEVKENAFLYMQGKNIKNIIAEVEKVATANAIDATERGKSGIEVKRDSGGNGNTSATEAFNKKYGIT